MIMMKLMVMMTMFQSDHHDYPLDRDDHDDHVVADGDDDNLSV